MVVGPINLTIHIALKFNVKLIFYGENGELEYAGDPSSIDKPFKDLIKDQNWFKGYLKGTSFDNLLKYAVKNKRYISKDLRTSPDLQFYKAPNKNEMIKKGISKIHYFNYFKKWNPQENFYYCNQYTNFTPNPERTEGTYSKYASLDDKMDGFH